MGLSMVERFALIGLNGQDIINKTNSKTIIMRCVAASIILDLYIKGKLTKVETVIQLNTEKNIEKAYEQMMLDKISDKKKLSKAPLSTWIKVASSLKYDIKKELEDSVMQPLIREGLVKEVPNLLGCDLDYVTSGIILKDYCTNEEVYLREVNRLKAEVLEENLLTDEIIVMLWLLRESGSLFRVFDEKEVEVVQTKLKELYQNKQYPLAEELLSIEVHESLEMGIKQLLNIKKDILKTPTGVGVSYALPALERSEGIFIDTEAMFANPEERLEDLKRRLDEKGHVYEVIKEGEVPLIKIDNVYYEAFPDMRRNRVTVYGIRLRRVVV